MYRSTLVLLIVVVWTLIACNLSAGVNSVSTPQKITPPATATDNPDPTNTPTIAPSPTLKSLPATAVLPPICNPRLDWSIYIVIAGDTLGKIAEAVHSNVTDLTIANCLANPNNLMVGRQIRVPRLPQATATPIIPTPYDQTPRILSFIQTSSYPPMLEWRTEHAAMVLIYVSDSTGENRLLGIYDPNSSISVPVTSGITTFRLTMRDSSGKDVIGPNGLPVYAIAQSSSGNPPPELECPSTTPGGTGAIDVAPLDASWSSCYILRDDQTVTLSWGNMPNNVRSIEYWFMPTAGDCNGDVHGNPNVVTSDMNATDAINATWFLDYNSCAGILYAFGYGDRSSFESGQRPIVIR